MTSISMERNGDGMDRSRFLHGPIYDSAADGVFAGDRRFPDDSDSCSSTSIGRNSDLSSSDGEEEDSGETEVQSSYKGPLDTMDALEDVLPVRKGISKFYSGKSKSFTSLADACSASNVKDIAKPENPYTKKRKNLLAHSMVWGKNLNPLRSGMPKKLSNCSRSSAALGMTIRSSESNNNSDDSSSISSSPSCSRPPLHPRGKRSTCIEIESSSPDSPQPLRSSPWRSFSLSDLQSVADVAVTPNNIEDKFY